MSDLTKNYGKDFIGSIAYTLGDNTSVTGGIANQVVVGASNSVALGGQTAIAAPLACSMTWGTYLEAIRGNNITWTNGATLSLTTGDNVNYQQTSRQQAQDYIELGAGLGYKDEDNWTRIAAQLITIKGVLGTLMAANAVLGIVGTLSGATLTKDTNTLTDSKTRMIAEAGSAVATLGANFLATKLLSDFISNLSGLFGKLEHATNLMVASDHIELDAEFGTLASPLKSFLFINKSLLKLAREGGSGNIAGSGITFDDDSSESRFVKANGAMSKVSKAVLTGDQLSLSAGTTTSTVSEQPVANVTGRKERVVTWNDTLVWQLNVKQDGISASGGPATKPASIQLADSSAILSAGAATSQSMMALTDQSAALAWQAGAVSRGLVIDKNGVQVNDKTNNASFTISATGISVEATLVQLGQ